MIHHGGTKGTKAAWSTEAIRERSHHQVVGVLRVTGALLAWDPFVPLVPFVPFVPSW
jgi:hypothetical protein